MHLESRLTDDNCVASVVSPLEADCPVRMGRELGYGLALALVPPLAAHQCGCGHKHLWGRPVFVCAR